MSSATMTKRVPRQDTGQDTGGGNFHIIARTAKDLLGEEFKRRLLMDGNLEIFLLSVHIPTIARFPKLSRTTKGASFEEVVSTLYLYFFCSDALSLFFHGHSDIA